MDKKDQILNTFLQEGKALKSQEISDKTGIEKKEVDKLIKELKKRKKYILPRTVITTSTNKKDNISAVFLI